MDNKYLMQAKANFTALAYGKRYSARLALLQKLCKEFEEYNVEWAVACSFELFLLGIVDDFHDFDILVAPKSFQDVCKILTRIGSRKSYDKDPSRQGCFSSKHFAEFESDGIDIDIICEFGFTTFHSFYQYHFNEADIIEVKVAGLKVPVVPPEAQYIFYGMMTGWQPQRAFKRDLICAYLHDHPQDHRGRHILEEALENEALPDFLLEGIHGLLNT